MTVNATLLAMLACPSDDHAPLRAESRDGLDVLVCTYCGTTYPVDDGIPVLLLDDATPGPNGIGRPADGSGGSGGSGGSDGGGSGGAGGTVATDEMVEAAPVEPAVAAVAAQQVPELSVDLRQSPKHAWPDGVEPEAAGDAVDDVAVEDVADVVEVADVLDADDIVADTEPDGPDNAPDTAPDDEPDDAPVSTDERRPQPPPPARTLSAGLRGRVERRLAEFETNHGPRRRRGER